jgi:hypothetical protein
MRTVAQAREIAERFLANAFGESVPALVDSATEEFDAGFVFYYQSAEFLMSRNPDDMLVGNAPLFVPRNDSGPTFISYHRPTSESVDAFKYCGDANAVPDAQVELHGWHKGALKVSATQIIREYSPVGLAVAHDVVEQCLAGRTVKLQAASVEAAREFVAKLAAVAFAARVTYGG